MPVENEETLFGMPFEVEWKWWTPPIFWVSELPLIRDCHGFQSKLQMFMIIHACRIKGWDK